MKEAIFYVDSVGMSARPEFYSGLGPRSEDLGYRHLSKIHGLVKNDGGDEVAQAFVDMVASLGSGAATTFLLGLYRLESNGWKHDGESVTREFDIGHSTTDRKEMWANGEATILATLWRGMGGPRDETAADFACRGQFLLEHGMTWDVKAKGWRRLKEGETQRRPLSEREKKHGYGDY